VPIPADDAAIAPLMRPDVKDSMGNALLRCAKATEFAVNVWKN
jgi:hypothetical protein